MPAAASGKKNIKNGIIVQFFLINAIHLSWRQAKSLQYFSQ